MLTNFTKYEDCRPTQKNIQDRKEYPEGHGAIQTHGTKKYYMINENNMKREVNEVQ